MGKPEIWIPPPKEEPKPRKLKRLRTEGWERGEQHETMLSIHHPTSGARASFHCQMDREHFQQMEAFVVEMFKVWPHPHAPVVLAARETREEAIDRRNAAYERLSPNS